jgi:hypothetical protein
MKFIYFSGNYIKHVGANLFDHLKVLEELYFHDNACIDREGFAKNSSEVQELIEKLKQECPDIETT